MTSISATEAKQQFAALLDRAQREPVRIRRHNRDVAVLVSAAEYEQLRRMRWEQFNNVVAAAAEEAHSNGLTEAKLAELLAD